MMNDNYDEVDNGTSDDSSSEVNYDEDDLHDEDDPEDEHVHNMHGVHTEDATMEDESHNGNHQQQMNVNNANLGHQEHMNMSMGAGANTSTVNNNLGHMQQQQQQHIHQTQQVQVPHPNARANPNSGSTSNSNSLDIDNEPPLEGYERTDRIGQGAYGIVYRGIQRSTGVTVAIKRIPFADAAPEGGVPCNVIREISLLRELDHPNVVRLLDVNQARPGELYLVFEFVAHDLKTFLDMNQKKNPDTTRRHGLPPSTVRSFMRQILEGVGFCHTYRILHRDLKPHNLLISENGRQVKLADFGLARLSGLPSGPYTSEVVTLWYRAPELLLGATRYCGPVDVWSIGCIFAEMATGYALFPGRSDIDQLFKIFQRRGTPTNEPSLNRLPHYNPDFPKWHSRSITDFVNLENFGSNHAADLLEQLLQYDPESRLICKQALHHPFFFET